VPSETTGAIADRYATALFELAEQADSLELVAKDMRALKQLLVESDVFLRMVRSPLLSREDQGRGITAVARGAGFNELSVKFLGLVAQNRRLFFVSGMAEAYLKKLSARKGEVTAEVTSAVALNDAQVNALVTALKQAVGAKVSLDMAVDPSLLGGLVVKVGSRMVDSSLKTKLRHLQHAMKGVG
jgi:F-type H+-transporting ATPase subunit delta